MYVIAIHSVSDPDAFCGAQLDLPEGTEMPIVAPSSDGTRGDDRRRLPRDLRGPGARPGASLRVARARLIAALAGLALLSATPTAASANHQTMAFSGRCPLDIIFPLSVDVERARELVPAEYTIGTDGTGRSLVIVSLVACEDTAVDGVLRSHAVYSDLLLQVDPPPDSGTPPIDHVFDAYWAWVVTDEPAVHAGLSRLGMFHGFDSDISLIATETSTNGRVLAVDGEVRWPHSPFRIHGDVVDFTPVGIPAYSNHFWQDVTDGRMLARLSKLPAGGPVAEEGRIAYFTLTTPAGTPLARLLADQCGTQGPECAVSGPGFVTQLPHFEYDITVQHDDKVHRCAGKAATKTGTRAGDTIRGTRGADVIVGRHGDDRIVGRGGADVICGKRGGDVLRGGAGKDRVVGGRRADRCRGGRGRDTAASCEKRRGIP